MAISFKSSLVLWAAFYAENLKDRGAIRADNEYWNQTRHDTNSRVIQITQVETETREKNFDSGIQRFRNKESVSHAAALFASPRFQDKRDDIAVVWHDLRMWPCHEQSANNIAQGCADSFAPPRLAMSKGLESGNGGSNPMLAKLPVKILVIISLQIFLPDFELWKSTLVDSLTAPVKNGQISAVRKKLLTMFDTWQPRGRYEKHARLRTRITMRNTNFTVSNCHRFIALRVVLCNTGKVSVMQSLVIRTHILVS